MTWDFGYGGGSPSYPLPDDLCLRWFLKLGFRSIGDNAFHANEGQNLKAINDGDAVEVSIFPIPKHASRS